MSKIPENLKYTKDHVWLNIEGNIVTLGITDYAQDQLGEILFVDVPEADSEIEAGAVFTEVESSKTNSEVPSPVSGTILEGNEELDDSPELVNEDAYKAWIAKVQVDSVEEIDGLLTASEYEGQLEQ